MTIAYLPEILTTINGQHTGGNLESAGKALRNVVGGTLIDTSTAFSQILNAYTDYKVKATAAKDTEALARLNYESAIIESVSRLPPDVQMKLVEDGFFDKVMVAGARERDAERTTTVQTSAEKRDLLKNVLLGGVIPALFQPMHAAQEIQGAHTARVMPGGVPLMKAVSLAPKTAPISPEAQALLEADPIAYMAMRFGALTTKQMLGASMRTGQVTEEEFLLAVDRGQEAVRANPAWRLRATTPEPVSMGIDR